MSDHEARLRDMHRDGSLGIGDYMGIDDESAAACLAGAEALRLVREYREAQKAHMENLGAADDSTIDRIISTSRALLTETPR